MTSISTIFCRLLASLVVIKSNCYGWSACRRVCRAVFAPLINCSWQTRRCIGARCQVWKTWTLLAENASPFLQARCVCKRTMSRLMLMRHCSCRSICKDAHYMFMRHFSFLYLLLITSCRIFLFSARYDSVSYYSVYSFFYLLTLRSPRDLSSSLYTRIIH